MKFIDLYKSYSFAEFLISSLESLEMKKENQPVSDSIRETGNVDMDFKINNIPIDPLEFFNRLEQAYDNDVKRKAQELVTEKFSEMESVYFDYCNLRKEMDKKVCKELGIEVEEY